MFFILLLLNLSHKVHQSNKTSVHNINNFIYINRKNLDQLWNKKTHSGIFESIEACQFLNLCWLPCWLSSGLVHPKFYFLASADFMRAFDSCAGGRIP